MGVSCLRPASESSAIYALGKIGAQMPYADKTKQREYQRNWMRDRRAAFMVGRTCADCGGANRLELHHRDPSQKISHKIFSWKEERMLAEAAKCDIVCDECHDKRHRLPPIHGRMSTYRKHKCRCELCKNACLADNRRRMLRRRKQRQAARAARALVGGPGQIRTDDCRIKNPMPSATWRRAPDGTG